MIKTKFQQLALIFILMPKLCLSQNSIYTDSCWTTFNTDYETILVYNGKDLEKSNLKPSIVVLDSGRTAIWEFNFEKIVFYKEDGFTFFPTNVGLIKEGILDEWRIRTEIRIPLGKNLKRWTIISVYKAGQDKKLSYEQKVFKGNRYLFTMVGPSYFFSGNKGKWKVFKKRFNKLYPDARWLD